MKKNKLKVGIVTSVLMLSMAMTTAFASKQGNFYYSNANAYVRGYVDLQTSKIFKDKIWCNVGLNGADRAAVSARYTLATDKEKIADGITLNYQNPEDRYIEKKCSKAVDYVRLTVKYEGKTGSITQKK